MPQQGPLQLRTLAGAGAARIFFLGGSAVYVVLATIFGLYCFIGGHNIMEMMYGGTATVVLTFAAAVEIAIFLPVNRRS